MARRTSLDGYKLQSGSPAIDKGAAITNNGGLDFWGMALTGTPDIGANEFREPPARACPRLSSEGRGR